MLIPAAVILWITALLAPLVAASPVDAAPEGRELSNAERLQRGLPVARPKRMYTGTRTHYARADSSPVPPQDFIFEVVDGMDPFTRKRDNKIGKRIPAPEYLAYNPATGFVYLTTDPTAAVVANGPAGDTGINTMTFKIGGQTRYACFSIVGSGTGDIYTDYAEIKASTTIRDENTFKCTDWTIPSVSATSPSAIRVTWAANTSPPANQYSTINVFLAARDLTTNPPRYNIILSGHSVGGYQYAGAGGRWVQLNVVPTTGLIN